LRENQEILEKIAQALLAYETIDGSEVDLLLKGAAVSEIEKVRTNKKDLMVAAVGPNVETTPSADTPPSAAKKSDPVGSSGPVTA
jgi:cell division protease FtsH